MPKKTKKEKIIALYRRKLKLLEVTEQSPSIKKQLPSQDILITSTAKKESKTTIDTEKNNENQIASFFLSDLKKSLILTGLVITLEILLYFVRIIK